MTEPIETQPLPFSGTPSQLSGTPNQPVPPVRSGGGGGGGCLYLLGGSVGCLALIVALLAAALFATGTTISNFVNGLGGIFQVNGFGVQQTKAFVIPEVEPFTNLSALTTITYNYANAVTVSTDMPPAIQALYGNSQVLVAVGSIEAGVDLGGLTRDDLTYDATQNTLTISLPGARITNCYLNDQKTYVAERVSGLFAADSTVLDTESRRYALQQFLTIAQEGNILLDAQSRAATIVQEFGQALVGTGGQDVKVAIVSEPINTVTLPETCG